MQHLVGHEIPVDRVAAAMLRRAAWYEKHPDDNAVAELPKYKQITVKEDVSNDGGLTADPPSYIRNRKHVLFGKAGNIVLGYCGIMPDGDDGWWVWFCKRGIVRRMSETCMRSTLRTAHVPN